MEQYYLAVDIGASSGRHILGHMENGVIRTEEIHRFENRLVEKDGHLCWDLTMLFEEILRGLEKCKELGKIPVSMGIDTWAVDYVLLNREGTVLGNTYCYRDHRTEGIDQKVYEIIPPEALYARTGIQKQIFNTIYQLMSVKTDKPELMRQAEHLLLIPDYFNYLLTGKMMTEYTNATTTQLVSPVTKTWDSELIRMLGYKPSLFGPVTMPGTAVGGLAPEIQDRVGFDLKVIQAATHDTASAVLAVPSTEENTLYISSGTWSLMGTERIEADCSEASRLANFTNEGGYGYRFRYLKNIMGLWMIQSVRHEMDDQYSFAELCQMADDCGSFPSRVDVNDPRFLAPESMTDAIASYCEETGQPVPETPGEIATVIYRSLADSYADAVRELEQLTGHTYKSIHIVGGGSNADYLNRLTSQASGLTCYCGPAEATAIGNLLVQLIRENEFETLSAAREAVSRSFDIRRFEDGKQSI